MHITVVISTLLIYQHCSSGEIPDESEPVFDDVNSQPLSYYTIQHLKTLVTMLVNQQFKIQSLVMHNNDQWRLVSEMEVRLSNEIAQQCACHEGCSDSEGSENLLPPHNCADIKARSRGSASGLFNIEVDGETVQVYCDMETDGGGWLVFQRRQDGSVDFKRKWDEYEEGFGDLGGEHWLGNKILHELTRNASYELRIDLEDKTGDKGYVKYDSFKIGSPDEMYRLNVGNYSGTAKDCFRYPDNKKMKYFFKFTTFDKYNDEPHYHDCTVRYAGGWWDDNCYSSNLNEVWGHAEWYCWQKQHNTIVRSEMKIRPSD